MSAAALTQRFKPQTVTSAWFPIASPGDVSVTVMGECKQKRHAGLVNSSGAPTHSSRASVEGALGAGITVAIS